MNEISELIFSAIININTAVIGPNKAPADRLSMVAGKKISGRIAKSEINNTGAQIPKESTLLAINCGYSLKEIPMVNSRYKEKLINKIQNMNSIFFISNIFIIFLQCIQLGIWMESSPCKPE